MSGREFLHDGYIGGSPARWRWAPSADLAGRGEGAARGSEKSDPDQFELALEDLETAIAAISAEEDAEDRAAKRPSRLRATNRGSLPTHLPRIEEVIEPESLTCGCGGCLHCIGEDLSGRLHPPRENSPPDCFLTLVDPGTVPRHRGSPDPVS